MSLNKLLLNGKIADGLDLEVKSINTAANSTTGIRGDLVVQGNTYLTGPVLVSDILTVDSRVNLDGQVFLNGDKFYMGGQLSNYGMVSIQLNNFQSTVFNYQKYGEIMHISGIVLADLIAIGASKFMECTFNMPPGYTLTNTLPYSRYFPVTGGGQFTFGVGSALGTWVATTGTPGSATTFKIGWNTGSGANVVSGNGQTIILNFSVYLDGIVVA